LEINGNILYLLFTLIAQVFVSESVTFRLMFSRVSVYKL